MKTTVVGVISDTHGLLREEAVRSLKDSDLLIHAGDIGSAEILTELRALAPTFAVRGNVDTETWAAKLPMSEVVEVGNVLFYVLHQIDHLDLDPTTAGFAVVVSGHSHQPSIETRAGVLYLNPGSAGPRRFRLPITVARVTVEGGSVHPEILELAV